MQREGLGNFDHLLVRNGKPVQPGAAGNFQAEPLEQRRGVGVDFPVVNQAEGIFGFAPEKDIRRHVQIVQHVEFLVDERHPRLHRVGDVVDLDGLTLQQELAAVRLIHAAENFHKRGLARAVLPAKRKDLAPADVQTDVVQGDDAGESF